MRDSLRQAVDSCAAAPAFSNMASRRYLTGFLGSFRGSLRDMQNILSDHMLNFIDGKVSVQSLSIAAQAEQADRETAKRVLFLLSGWNHGAASSHALRQRVRDLI